MSRGRGRRRGPRGGRDAVSQASAAWREHERQCWSCHAADGHPGLFCDTGWTIAQAVTRARQAIAATAAAQQRPQAGLW